MITALVVARQVLAVRENVRLLAETAARQNEVRFRSLVQHSSDVIIVIRPDGAIRFVSPSVSRVLGYEPEALNGRALIRSAAPRGPGSGPAFCREAGQLAGRDGAGRVALPPAGRSLLHAEIIATNLLDDPTVRGIVLNTRDVSERKRLEQQLLHQAFHDPLTGLANRALFRDRVSHALALARRRGNADHGAVPRPRRLQDGERQPGPRRGRPAADRRGRAIPRLRAERRHGGAARRRRVRDPDRGCRRTGRTGGLVDRLAAAMAQPFIAGRQPRCRSAPASAWPHRGGDDTADDLLRNADMAMYTAKRRRQGPRRRPTSRACTPTSASGSSSRPRSGARIESDQLILHYQPIVNLQSGGDRGVEALVRWDHPQSGLLLPQHSSRWRRRPGSSCSSGRGCWARRAGSCQVWRAAHPELPLRSSVNISGRQLQGRGLVGRARARR